MKRYMLPLVLFLALASTLALGLRRDPQAKAELPSPLVGKPAPAFTLTHLADAHKQFSPKDLKGQVWLLNVWASWCVSCRQEHPLLVDFSKQGRNVPIVGLNYQDQREAGLKWLSQHGDPYQLTAFDADGRVGMDLGVYGVPETFLVDKQGRIRFRHAGPITPELLKGKLQPLIEELQRG